MNKWLKWILVSLFGGGIGYVFMSIFILGLIKLNEEDLAAYVPPVYLPICEERDSVVTFNNVKLLLHFRDCPTSGIIDVKCNKPVYGHQAIDSIMAMDNVIDIEGAGLGPKSEDLIYDRRECTIRYHFNRTKVTKGICEIAKQWK